MLCRNPFMQGMHAYPCGQCMPCRLNRRRIWTHRLMLEASLHPASSFLTLTYDDSTLPLTTSIGQPMLRGASAATDLSKLPTLNPKDLQDWLKRFRKAIRPSKIRYYAVGEYGDASGRPHYHVALFGYPACHCHLLNKNKKLEKWVSCPICAVPAHTWNAGNTRGNILLGELSLHSAQYVAGYVTKKMTGKDDYRLNGRHPEFARMSRRPGIGADAMPSILQAMMDFNLDTSQADVPVSLRHGSRMLPLGRFLRRKLRILNGGDGRAPQEILDQQFEEMRALFQTSINDPSFVSIKNALVDQDNGKVASMEAKQRIFKKDKTI